MQNLNVKETIQNIKKTSKIKKELEESIINGKEIENTDMQEKVNNCTTNEDAVKLIQEFEEILKNKKAILYGWPTIKAKYFKSLKKKNDLLAWF